MNIQQTPVSPFKVGLLIQGVNFLLSGLGMGPPSSPAWGSSLAWVGQGGEACMLWPLLVVAQLGNAAQHQSKPLFVTQQSAEFWQNCLGNCFKSQELFFCGHSCILTHV